MSTSLTDLQRWAELHDMRLAPQALKALKDEGYLEAEAVATLPDSELLKLRFFKGASLAALRAWQAEQGIPVTPDPPPQDLRSVTGDILGGNAETGRAWDRLLGIDGLLKNSMPLLPRVHWFPITEREVAWQALLELLKPSPVMAGAVVNVEEAVKRAWLAADAWKREREARETAKGETDGAE